MTNKNNTPADLNQTVGGKKKLTMNQSTTTLQLNKINQVWLDCTDLDQAEAFYHGVLGLPIAGDVPNMMKLFNCGQVQLILGKKEQSTPNSYIYFEVEGVAGAIDQAYESLKQAGVKVQEPPHCIAENWQGFDVWLAFFDDPFGNKLALKSDVPSGG